MRPWELTLLVLLLVWSGVALVSLGRARPRWFRTVFVLACLITAAQVLLEGWRLQMAPAYLSLPLIALSSLRIPGLPTRVFLISIVTVCALFSLAATYAFPVFSLPEPQGPYPVGTFVSHLVDRSRHERHAPDANAPREFMIQVWHPAKNRNGERAWYRDPRMNTWRSNHLRLVKTHSYWNLAAADQPQTFPVLLFSPSSGGNRNQNTFEVEELASQGYVVVGIDHPYSSSRVVFPDGRIAHSVPWVDASSRAAFEASVANVELMVQDHVGDARFVLDEMERWNRPGSGHLLSGRLSLAKAGVFGHSFGGAMAGAACLADSRIVAGINMDGWMFGEAERAGVAKPFFFMNSGDGEAPDASRIAKLPDSDRLVAEKDLTDWQSMQKSLRRFGGYHLTILGSGHPNYSDLVLFTRPLPFQSKSGVNPYRAFQIVNAFTLAFFDRYVRDRPAPLLDRGGFPGEVRYESHKPDPTTALTQTAGARP